MTTSRNHSIAVSDREFAILDIVHQLGTCSSEDVQQKIGSHDLLMVMRTLHSLAQRGLLIRPERNGQLHYRVKPSYTTFRSRMIVLEGV